MHTILQHGCKSIIVESFDPNNCNAVSIHVETEHGLFDITLFGLPDCEVAKLASLGKPRYGEPLPTAAPEQDDLNVDFGEAFKSKFGAEAAE